LKDKYESTKIRFVKRLLEDAVKGAASSRNTGAKVAKYKLLMFLDSDDLIAPWCIEERRAAIKKNPTKDFYVFVGLEFDKENDYHHRLRTIHDLENPLTSFLSFQSVWQTSCLVWKKSIFEKVGGWSEQAKSWQDGEIHVRLLLKSENYLWGNKTPDVFIRRHLDQNRISNNQSIEKRSNLYNTYINILKYFEPGKHKNMFKENMIFSLFDWTEDLERSKLDSYKNWVKSLSLNKNTKRKLINYINVSKTIKKSPLSYRMFLQIRKRLGIPAKKKPFWSIRPTLDESGHDQLKRKAQKHQYELPFKMKE